MSKIFKARKYDLLLGQKTYVMAILNVTPDSFSDGGRWSDHLKAIQRAFELKAQEADILDIGAQSTRPGYVPVSPEVELQRIAPVLKGVCGRLDIPISVDTYYPEVAEYALSLGVDIINDVTGFKNEKMVELAAKYKCGCIVTHDSSEAGIKSFFEERLEHLTSKGIDSASICFDPGIGFNKTYEENIDIIRNIKDIIIDECASLIGASRKRVIGESCGNPPFSERAPGTIAAHTIAIEGGIDIVRAHDAAEAVQAARVADAILRR